LIEIERVSKEFVKGERRVTALQDIDLAVAPREFAAILGPSGCGKSTLLNMVAGFDRPTGGSVRFSGEEIVAPSPQRAVVFQEPALFPWLSVMQNVVFGPKTQGQPAAEYRARAAQIIEQVGLQGFESSYPAELSGGMRQRVGIARVLIMQPQVLLMDEPFGSLDAQTRSLMQELLLAVWERHHQTVLFVTHDIEEALLLADSVSVMTARPGRIKTRLPVDLPRPRALDVVTSPLFNALKRDVLALIREESLRGGRRLARAPGAARALGDPDARPGGSTAHRALRLAVRLRDLARGAGTAAPGLPRIASGPRGRPGRRRARRPGRGARHRVPGRCRDRLAS
jgi:NitT/TauT family transport system ATP-binding protein